MKFIIHGGALSRSLHSISSVVPSGRTMPILLNFLLEVENDQLKLTASDLETTISVKLIPGMLEQDDVNKIA
ncbi:MAG: DNA polymerase III subunit beta, partial [Bacteroidales bacterium]|nr:DNA polymerase III subunit beta [Bacteroidales bacterium]